MDKQNSHQMSKLEQNQAEMSWKIDQMMESNSTVQKLIINLLGSRGLQCEIPTDMENVSPQSNSRHVSKRSVRDGGNLEGVNGTNGSATIGEDSTSGRIGTGSAKRMRLNRRLSNEPTECQVCIHEE